MDSKKSMWTAFALLMLAMAVIQFVPSAPVIIPAGLPPEQRDAPCLLGFEGIANFRDLGGYPTAEGKRVAWGRLYRSGTLAHSSRADLEALGQLNLVALIDFRSTAEKEEEPNILPDPPGFELVEIPTLDQGNEALLGEVMERVDSGDFTDFDPNKFMLEANRQFAGQFTPEFRRFVQAILAADGAPVAWHCSAGKDRTGYAAAILLRILGVPQELVMQDYMASREHALEARKSQLMLLRLFKGEEAADKLGVMMGVEQAWLEAAFNEIDRRWGSFDDYVSQGLQLSPADITRLRSRLLE